jgi:hypothetical protein
MKRLPFSRGPGLSGGHDEFGRKTAELLDPMWEEQIYSGKHPGK